ncbi:MAG TPA: DinB family protein [Vicinamibacterales bacterium]|nr:DinB family protein [Vicinamibacterales bacterium]
MLALIPWVERRWAFDLPPRAFPAVLERLRGTPARATALVTGLPESLLGKRLSRTWSVKEHLGHLDDLCELDMRRLDEFLGGATVLTAADPSNRRTEEAAHRDRPTADLVKALGEKRQRLILRLEGLTEADVSASARHPRLGIPLRVIDWAQFVADHDDHHLAAARIVLRALTGQLP